MDKTERARLLVEKGLWEAQSKVLSERWEQVQKAGRKIAPAERSKKILLVAGNGVELVERAGYVAMIHKKTGATVQGSSQSTNFTADVLAESSESQLRVAVMDKTGVVQISTVDLEG